MPEYLDDVKELRNLMDRIDKKRKELLIIREELLERNIEVDGGQE